MIATFLFIICCCHPPLNNITHQQHQLTYKRAIIEEYRNGFFSIMNHFYVLGAELLEKFFICGDCNVPIGFAHSPLCAISNEPKFKWMKKKFDDKYITYEMKFDFNELMNPAFRNDIIMMTVKNGLKVQKLHRETLPSITKMWPAKWLRGSEKNKYKNAKVAARNSRNKFTSLAPIFHPSAWTPSSNDNLHSIQNYDVISLSYRHSQVVE
jgi:hypothetical protein